MNEKQKKKRNKKIPATDDRHVYIARGTTTPTTTTIITKFHTESGKASSKKQVCSLRSHNRTLCSYLVCRMEHTKIFNSPIKCYRTSDINCFVPWCKLFFVNFYGAHVTGAVITRPRQAKCG